MITIICDDEGNIVRDYLFDKNHDEVKQIKKTINPCTCGNNNLKLKGSSIMNDVCYSIYCKKCKRKLRRSQYDYDIQEFDDILNFLIRDWNNNITQNDLIKAEQNEYNRIRLTNNDFSWKNYYPNNMPENGLEGLYALLFRKDEDKIYCCKWTIQFQKEEIEPMTISENSKIESYNLFMKRYFDIQGNLFYPEPTNVFSLKEDKNTLNSHDVNSTGDFIRNYKTLEEAKLGALARCGWQKLNKDTILQVPQS